VRLRGVLESFSERVSHFRAQSNWFDCSFDRLDFLTFFSGLGIKTGCSAVTNLFVGTDISLGAAIRLSARDAFES